TFQSQGVNSTGFSAYTSGGTVYGGSVPPFTPAPNPAFVTATIAVHGMSTTPPNKQNHLPTPTTVGRGTIKAPHSAVIISDANNFTITGANQANANAGATPMNSSNAQLVYSITLGPPALGGGYSSGNYSAGGYSIGSGGGSAQTGTKIVASDWTLDNWG